MRRIIAPFLIILFAATTLVSCLKDEDENKVLYKDTAITAFVINRMLVKKVTKSSKGEDSTYVVKQSGTSFRFTIDQNRCEIQNLDSLPYGTDPTKLLISVKTEKNGIVGLKKTVGTDINTITGNDTLDFSVPRTLVVMSPDGQNTREYVVKVNVHKQKADDFNWTMLSTNAEMAAFKAFRAFEINGRIVAFGSDGTKTAAMQTAVGDGKEWTSVTFNFNGLLDKDAYRGIVKKGDRLYMMHAGQLMASADGSAWDVISTPAVEKLVAASGNRLFGYDAEGNMLCSYDGVMWTADEIDSGKELLPTTDINYSCTTLRTNNDVEQVVLMGNRGTEYAADTTAVIWGRLDDRGQFATNMPWAYYETDGDGRFVMPRLADMSMTLYGDVMLAVGGKGIPPCKAAAFERIYASADCGITWSDDARYQLPEGIDKNASAMALVTDGSNRLWIICAGTGQIWRGRLNRMGWQ
ncbi:MAG: DUF6242 domain-containing protein [Prevotella sp.]|uniref:DUF6242 domain-containing protein n=1 Tax=Prevotella sp. TaxID=59823 RepID=UPI002A3335D8|nr:DUF6242 domain-containing protein [Prevotella sp.]MDD7317780.1 DUF6242 domain-containing protein [Prevotellaceae bacterium]MDY4020695.1 DUF6242 domain-containing protein [Prevotella sp.]